MTARAFRPMGGTPAAAALAAVLLLVAGCTASSGGGTPTGTGLPAAASSPPSASQTTGPADDASTRMTPPSSPPATSTPPATPSGLPGGSGDSAALTAAGDLTEAGLIDLRGQPGSAPGDSADLCDFLFGAPDRIAAVTRLSDDLTLDAISGRHRTSEPTPAGGGETTGAAGPATVIACVYASRGTPVLALQVGDGPPIDSDLPGHPIIVDSGDLHAVLSYSPDHTGATIAPVTARAWLTAAIGRVAPTGSG